MQVLDFSSSMQVLEFSDSMRFVGVCYQISHLLGSSDTYVNTEYISIFRLYLPCLQIASV